jgi:hypothetical protein
MNDSNANGAPSLSAYSNEDYGWVIVQAPFGLVPPPRVVFHKPLEGPVEFDYQGPYADTVEADRG